MKKYKMYLRVWEEYGSSGIWSIENPKQKIPIRMVSYEMLNLPQSLIDEFKSWIDDFDENQPFPPSDWDSESFDKKGDELSQKLKDFLGDEYYVEREIDGGYENYTEIQLSK